MLWIKSRAWLCLIVVTTGSILVATALAPSGVGKTRRPGPRPDLVVAKATKHGDRYVPKGFKATLGFKDRTENLSGGHDAPADASRTGMLLVPKRGSGHEPGLKLGSRRVPRLTPGATALGATTDRVDADILPLGAYKILVCADVKHEVAERNEGNNCRQVGNFYVIQDSWTGSVDGVGPAGSAGKAETWHAPAAHLDLERYAGNGVFVYDFGGNVTWNDDGVTTGGCAVSGGGAKLFDHLAGPIKLDYEGGKYQGTVRTDPFYTVTYTPISEQSICSFQQVPGPLTKEILNIPQPKGLTFDQDALTGRFANVSTSWDWDFH